jgi:hypothetical protein
MLSARIVADRFARELAEIPKATRHLLPAPAPTRQSAGAA